MTTLNRLLNADNECVGYFTDNATGHAAMQAARAEWNTHYVQRSMEVHTALPDRCRSIATPIKPLEELEDVEPGDGDRVGYHAHPDDCPVAQQMHLWLQFGAASVEVQRHEINRYRRPGKSNRSTDLGGPEQAVGVLYVLTIKASK